jgi:ribosomal protein S18 acetylase RimI-like enzyme
MVSIRTVEDGDVDQIVELWREAAGPTSLPCGAREVVRLVERDRDALLVAAADGEVVGTLIVGWDGWRCNLYRMSVRPDHRRSQVATALVAAAHERARAVGAERLDAIVDLDNPGGIAFWESMGFSRKLNNGRWCSTR